MTDEIRVTREDPNTNVDVRRSADGELLIEPDVRGNPAPLHTPPPISSGAIDDPEVARAEIEMTRARMSETIDGIEEALVRKKEQFQDKMDVFGPVRENALPSAGIALGAGLLLGLITGGDEDEREYRDRARHTRHSQAAENEAEHWRRRAETWEDRAYRLRDIAREQEDEIRYFEERWGEERARDLNASEFDERNAARARARNEVREREHWEEERAPGAIGSALDDLRDRVTDTVTDYVTRGVEQLTTGLIGSAPRRG